jgi:hypothetical protein
MKDEEKNRLRRAWRYWFAEIEDSMRANPSQWYRLFVSDLLRARRPNTPLSLRSGKPQPPPSNSVKPTAAAAPLKP